MSSTTGARPLARMLNDQILAELGSFVQEETKSATFACGGEVNLKDDPVTIRWDPTDAALNQGSDGAELPPRRLALPATSDSKKMLDILLQDCQPATFGQDGADVYDESYRKAVKMNTSQFCHSFSPYEHKIIDVISQALLPSVVGESNDRGVRAELYKLNVYSGPSGMFKKHVDTPRSDKQFGSLVICLPCEHKGGELVVRHKGVEAVFDWGAKGPKPQTVQWAAFYSDCEHEVLEVTSGHRITLTYNLYITRGSGALAGRASALYPPSLPLYDKMKTALENPGFMPEGGTLGIHCAHLYAHTNARVIRDLPCALKGADMATWCALRALGLEVQLQPYIENPYDPWYESEHEDKSGSDDDSLKGEETFSGTKLHRVRDAGFVDDDGGELDAWDHVKQSVKWITKHHQGPSELAMHYVAYGNEPSSGATYSWAGIFVKIPAFVNRELESLPVELDASSESSAAAEEDPASTMNDISDKSIHLEV